MELTFHSGATLILTGFALFLFAQEKLRLETSSLVILVLLTLLFSAMPFYKENGMQLSAVSFFSGFGHEALVAICSLMILGKGIEVTGGLKPLTRVLSRYWSRWPKRTFLLALLISAVLSGFLNNTPIIIMLIPVLISVAYNSNTSPSKVLIPVGFATLIGGMATTIGTSTNLLVVAIASDISNVNFNMFDFVLPVILVGSVGIVLLWSLAPLILPERQIELSNVNRRIYNAVLFLPESSTTEGKLLHEVLQKINHELQIHKIMRGKNQFILPLPTVTLKAGDGLFVSGTVDKLKECEEKLDGTLHNIDIQGELLEGEYITPEDDQVLAEVLVTEGSLLSNRSLKQARIAEKYNLIVLALHRLHQPLEKIDEKVSKVILKRGDILLVQGTRENINLIKEDTKLLILDNVMDHISSKKAPLAMMIMTGVVFLAALQLLPIAISALCGVVFMLLGQCIRWRDITKALSTQVILVIVVSLALGSALLETGGVDYLADKFVYLTSGMSTIMTLCALLFTMSILTNVVSNAAAAVIGTPVAVKIALLIGAPLEPFILAVLFGANMSYATPISYQTNILIYSAGGYKFSDFMRVGIPLTLVIGTGFTLVLAYLYELV